MGIFMPVLRTSDSAAYRGYKEAAPNGARPVLRIARCVSETERKVAESEPKPERRASKSELEPSRGSPLLAFARDCSALLAFCTGSFFCGEAKMSPLEHSFILLYLDKFALIRGSERDKL
jgi:hypothetical protein